jgi:hypothetical protein
LTDVDTNTAGTLTKWRIGWTRGLPERIEEWLESMERKGWHLVRVNLWGWRFRFDHGEPRGVRYCVDFQTEASPEYHNLLADAGWELIYQGGGWYFWRKPYDEERPEIYTDRESLVQRNKRIMSNLGILAAGWAVISAEDIIRNLSSWLGKSFFSLVMLAIIVLGIARLRHVNRQLTGRG